jgi:RNA polymerase sigma-70 factor (ECF subfamily)
MMVLGNGLIRKREGYARLAEAGTFITRAASNPGELMHARLAQPAADNDLALVKSILLRDEAAFETVMRRYNGRLFRVARAILSNDPDAEDALQDAYLDAFRHMDGFRGDAQLGTWLTRIVVNQALMRLRRQKRDRVVLPFTGRDADDNDLEMQVADRQTESPSEGLLRAELRRLLERRIDELPVAFRAVFVMRDIEDMTVQETADSLSIPAATVRSRLFRARALLREALARDVDTATLNVFGFAGARCDRVVAAVLARWRPTASH